MGKTIWLNNEERDLLLSLLFNYENIKSSDETIELHERDLCDIVLQKLQW